MMNSCEEWIFAISDAKPLPATLRFMVGKYRIYLSPDYSSIAVFTNTWSVNSPPISIK